MSCSTWWWSCSSCDGVVVVGEILVVGERVVVVSTVLVVGAVDVLNGDLLVVGGDGVGQ